MLHTTGDYFVCPTCVSCSGTCQCEKSVYHGLDLDNLPFGGCNQYLSRRKWSVSGEKKRKKRKKKWPTMEEFEFGY